MVKYRYVWGKRYPIYETAVPSGSSTSSTSSSIDSEAELQQRAARAAARTIRTGTTETVPGTLGASTVPGPQQLYEVQGKWYTEEEIKRLPAPTPQQTLIEKQLNIPAPAHEQRYFFGAYDPEARTFTAPTKETPISSIVRVPESKWTSLMSASAQAGRSLFGTQFRGPLAQAGQKRRQEQIITDRVQYQKDLAEYNRQKAEYDKWVGEQVGIQKASQTWQASLGFGLGYQQIGGIKTVYEVAEAPVLAAIRTGGTVPTTAKLITEPDYRRRYFAALREQTEKLVEKHRAGRVALVSEGYYEPEKFVRKQVVGIGVTTAALLLPEFLPAASAAFTSVAPPMYAAAVKTVAGAAVATYGAVTVAKSVPKIQAGEPGSTLDFALGASLTYGGSKLFVSSGSEMLRLSGQELQKGALTGRYEYQEGRLTSFTPDETGQTFLGGRAVKEVTTRQLRYRFGAGLETIGEVPGRVTEFFRPTQYKYFTSEYPGGKTNLKFKTEYAGEYGGGRIERKSFIVEGVEGQWQPDSVTIGTIRPGGSQVSVTELSLSKSYAGRPPSMEAFDIIGFYGGQTKIKSLLPEGASELEIRLAEQFLAGEKIHITTPSTALVLDSTKIGTENFDLLVENYPSRMFRMSGDRTFLGTTEVIGSAGETLVELMPIGSEGEAVVSFRFVEGPKVYKPFTIKVPPADLEAAYLANAFKRAALPDSPQLDANIFKFEIDQMGIKIATSGDTLIIGGSPTPPSSTGIISGGSGADFSTSQAQSLKYVPKTYTYRISAPGEPVLPDMSAGGIGLVDIATTGKIDTMFDIRTAPKMDTRLQTKARAVSKLVPKLVSRTVPKAVPKLVPRTVPKAVSKLVPRTTSRAVLKTIPKLVPKIVPKLVPKLIPKTVPRVIPTPRTTPRTAQRLYPVPSRSFGKRKIKRPRFDMRFRQRRRQKTVVILPKADYLTIQREELLTGKKAKHPAATRLTMRAFTRRQQRPAAPVLKFPTARGVTQIRKRQKGLKIKPIKSKSVKKKKLTKWV